MARKFAQRVLRNASWITLARAAEISKRSDVEVMAAVESHGLASKVVSIGENSYTLVDRAVLQMLSEPVAA